MVASDTTIISSGCNELETGHGKDDKNVHRTSLNSPSSVKKACTETSEMIWSHGYIEFSLFPACVRKLKVNRPQQARPQRIRQFTASGIRANKAHIVEMKHIRSAKHAGVPVCMCVPC